MKKELTWVCQPFEALSLIDLYNLLQLRSRVFVVEQQAIYQDIDGRDPICSHLLLKSASDGVVACCRLIPPDTENPQAMIGRVVVDPLWRGRGLAHELMRQAVNWCQTLFGDVPIRLSAQKHLRGFYARHGFQTCTGDYLEDGILHVGMIRHPSGNMARWQARYLGHSAWLITTANRLFLFDYGSHPPRPNAGRLSEGVFNLDELPDLPLYCFVSHQHRDHYSPEIRQALTGRSRVRYILGLDEQPDSSLPEENDQGFWMAWPHRIFQMDDLTVFCSGSTDSGVSFMIRAPEAVIYHGGDLALWDDDDFYRRVYRQEIDWMVQTGCQPDLAMLPVSTSDGYQEEPLLSGLQYCLEQLAPAAVLPMHAHGFEHLYRRFANLTEQEGKSVIYVPAAAGDVFGRID